MESFVKAQMNKGAGDGDAPQLLDESDSSDGRRDVLACSPPTRLQQPTAANDVDLQRRVLPLVTWEEVPGSVSVLVSVTCAFSPQLLWLE